MKSHMVRRHGESPRSSSDSPHGSPGSPDSRGVPPMRFGLIDGMGLGGAPRPTLSRNDALLLLGYAIFFETMRSVVPTITSALIALAEWQRTEAFRTTFGVDL